MWYKHQIIRGHVPIRVATHNTESTFLSVTRDNLDHGSPILCEHLFIIVLLRNAYNF